MPRVEEVMTYGRSKPGRPVANTEAERNTPRCTKCANLRVDANRDCRCASGHDFEPKGCTDYDDISQPRVQIFGGITGIAAP